MSKEEATLVSFRVKIWCCLPMFPVEQKNNMLSVLPLVLAVRSQKPDVNRVDKKANCKSADNIAIGVAAMPEECRMNSRKKKG